MQNSAAIRGEGETLSRRGAARKLIAVGAEGVKTIIRCLAERRGAVRARRGSGADAASAGARGMKTAQRCGERGVEPARGGGYVVSRFNESAVIEKET